jgi:hypothetical protein
MKNLKEFYQFLLKEQAFAKPEAPPSAELGQYAFAPSRTDTPDPKEPNTNIEDKILKALKLYVGTNHKSHLSQVAPDILKLKKLGYYKSVLDPSKYSEVYRFLIITGEVLAEILGVPEITAQEGVSGPGVLNPRAGDISGWTVNPKQFMSWGTSNEYIALFIAPVNGNQFFGNPGTMAVSIGMDAEYQQEMETIAVGPVRYSKCYYEFMPDISAGTPGKLIKKAGI